jgi:predicted kinase
MGAEMRTLLLIRGLPGSGKTTLARKLSGPRPGALCVAADDFFMAGDEYMFDPSRLKEVHETCLRTAGLAMRNGTSLIIVHNTFSQRWEMQRYMARAKQHGYQVHVIDLFNAGLSIDELVARNVHDVPYDAVRKMWERWEHDWRTNAERQTVKFRPGNYRPQEG